MEVPIVGGGIAQTLPAHGLEAVLDMRFLWRVLGTDDDAVAFERPQVVCEDL